MKFPLWLKVFGDQDFRGKCPTETAEQVAFFNQIRKTHLGAIALHIENEGKRHAAQVASSKVMGMVAGAPDIIIPGSPTFICELKRQDHTKSRFQPGQLEYLEAAHHAGAFVCVALGSVAALNAVKYFKQNVDRVV